MTGVVRIEVGGAGMRIRPVLLEFEMANSFRPGQWLRSSNRITKETAIERPRRPVANPPYTPSIDSDIDHLPDAPEPEMLAAPPTRSIQEEIEMRAYRKWLAAGRPADRYDEFRRQAETEVLRERQYGE